MSSDLKQEGRGRSGAGGAVTARSGLGEGTEGMRRQVTFSPACTVPWPTRAASTRDRDQVPIKAHQHFSFCVSYHTVFWGKQPEELPWKCHLFFGWEMFI